VEARPPRVVVIGTLTADLFVRSPQPAGGSGADGFTAGNVVYTDAPARVVLGGNGGNSAYVMAGLGAPTVLCGAVGRDPLGDTLLGWLRERGVGLDGVARLDRATSTAAIVMTDAASQVVYYHPGATAETRLEDVPAAVLDGAGVLLASSYPLLPRMRAGGFARALAAVHDRGGITALDVGPTMGTPVTLDEVAPLLPALDYLIANRQELGALAGAGAEDGDAAAARLLAAGARRLVIKRGAGGATLRTAEGAVDAPAFPVPAVVSVGAGDTFNAGFLYGVARRWSPERALRFGNALAALVVTSERGILGAPTLHQVEAFLAAHP